MQILVVDDSWLYRFQTSEILAEIGYASRACGNGEEALSLVQANPAAWRLILMDIHMPVMGGEEAARKLRDESSTRDIPLVALTNDQTWLAAHEQSLDPFDAAHQKPNETKGFATLVDTYAL